LAFDRPAQADNQCLPLAVGAAPSNTAVVCSGNVTNQNNPNGYGNGQQSGDTITVQPGAIVKGTGPLGSGFLLGTNNIINNSGAIVGVNNSGVDASAGTSITVNNLTTGSSITGRGI